MNIPGEKKKKKATRVRMKTEMGRIGLWLATWPAGLSSQEAMLKTDLASV